MQEREYDKGAVIKYDEESALEILRIFKHYLAQLPTADL